jgi:hypothetical protein
VAAKPAKPNPPLSSKCAEELARIAERTDAGRPTTASTPTVAPLNYWGLARNVKREGYPEWVITARGRAWLAADAAYRAARRPRRPAAQA